MVFYRTYRPQKIEELDNENLRETLYSVFSSDDTAHAFLFTGPKGLGKTSTARIVAKVINCEKVSKVREVSEVSKGEKKARGTRGTLDTRDTFTVEPCNECDQCVSITNGSNLDVLEIDAASNRGIDEIRELRDKIRLAPVSARKKVYIIDEVHMLTTEAFNALLKTLEEPPKHVVFILCTTESYKVPSTIASRCFQITFKKATDSELKRAFGRIVKKEKISISDDALSTVANLSEGSFRDGVKLLEELRLLSGDKKIEKEFVEKKFQIFSVDQHVLQLLQFLSERKVKEAILLLQSMAEQGVEILHFQEALLLKIHAILMIRLGIEEKDLMVEGMPFSIEDIKKLSELISESYKESKYAVIPHLPLQLAILEWGEGKGTGGNLTHVASDVRPAKNTSMEKSQNQAEPNAEKRTEPQSGSAPAGQLAGKTSSASFSDKNNFWEEFITAVKKQNHSLAGVLRGCQLKSFDHEKVVVETSFKFHKERLSEKKAQELLSTVASETSGKNMEVSVILRDS